MRSLLLVFPLWSATGGLSAEMLSRSLSWFRRMSPEIELPWGCLTAPDPSTLSLLAARTVMQEAIARDYAERHTLVVNLRETSLRVSPRDWPSGEPVEVLDDRSVRFPGAVDALRDAASALIFQGHGRSYCACDGYLCGARGLGADPFAATDQCIRGFSCADEEFPRIDPRSFDTPFLVLDTCGAGSAATGLWHHDIASLACLALAGSPTAVVTSDAITYNVPRDFVDVLWAFGSAETLGQGLRRLNDRRRSGNISHPYFLLGDPDVVAGERRWPRWVGDARPELATDDGPAFLLNRQGRAFLRVRVPDAPRAGSQLVLRDGDGKAVPTAGLFPAGRAAELWVGERTLPPEPLRASVEAVPTISVPRRLGLDAAVLLGSAEAWLHHFRDRGRRLRNAAARLLELADRLEMPGHASDGSLLELSEWVAAQAAIVRELTETAAAGLWPFALWTMRDVCAEISDRTCPYCNACPTVIRRYKSDRTNDREWWECMACDLISDLPLMDGEGVTVEWDPPNRLHGGDRATVSIKLSNQTDESLLGAAAVVVDRSGHGVSMSPEIFPVTVPPQSTISKDVELEVDLRPAIPHLYRVRGILLLNARWHWLSRPVEVLAPTISGTA